MKITEAWSDRRLLSWIDDLWNPSDQWCGGLIMSFNPAYRHYWVGLNNDFGLGWGYDGETGGFSVDLLPDRSTSIFKMLNRREEGVLPRPTIYQHVRAAVKAYNQRWLYRWRHWNCEHLARLITTGESNCYQMPCRGRDEEAEEDFWKALSRQRS